MLVSLMVLATPALAAEEMDTTLPDPGITPDSPIYGLDKAVEGLELAFTFGEENKARVHYKFAKERLAEAEKMAVEDKPELAEEVMGDYEKELTETESEMEKAVARGKNVTQLAEHVATMTAKHLEVLQRVYDKVPEQAKAAIAHAMEVSVRKQVGVLAHIENG